MECVASAQSPGAVTAAADKAVVLTYRSLFLRALSYNKLADDADAQGAPKPHLRHVIADRYQLSSDQEAAVQRLAVAYQAEIDPIHQQALATMAKFRAQYPNGIIQNIADVVPPPELHTFQTQEDSITLRYRSLMRNAMEENSFQKLNAKLVAEFGGVSQ